MRPHATEHARHASPGGPLPHGTPSLGTPRNPRAGVGIVWRVARAPGVPNDILVVDAFDPKSSAAEADLRQGDILSRVDGVDVIGTSAPPPPLPPSSPPADVARIRPLPHAKPSRAGAHCTLAPRAPR